MNSSDSDERRSDHWETCWFESWLVNGPPNTRLPGPSDSAPAPKQRAPATRRPLDPLAMLTSGALATLTWAPKEGYKGAFYSPLSRLADEGLKKRTWRRGKRTCTEGVLLFGGRLGVCGGLLSPGVRV